MIRRSYLAALRLCVWLCLPALPAAAQSAGYVLSELDFKISAVGAKFLGGSTREGVLRSFLGVQEGQLFNSRADLDKAVAGWQERLRGNRTFDPSSSVAYQEAGSADAQGRRQVKVVFNVVESVNLIALPYPKYDANTGLTLGLRLRHFNFLGFMRTLYGSFNYKNEVDEDDESKTNLIIELSANGEVPLRFSNRDWTLFLGIGGAYQSKYDDGESYFHLTGGLATAWRLAQSRFYLHSSVFEGLYLMSERETYYANDGTGKDPDLFGDPYYLQTGIDFALPMPLFVVPKAGWLMYRPSLGASIKYRFDRATVLGRRGIFPYFNHRFTLENVVHLGNFRKGFQLSLYNNIDFSPYYASLWGVFNGRRIENAWHIETGFTAAGFLPLNSRMALYGRTGYKYIILDDDMDDDLGGPVRGIRNNRMKGDMIVYWNVDLVMKAWIWRFDFLGEALASIFYDGGAVRPYDAKGFDRPFHALGLELQLYPSFARNLRLRTSFGVDIEAALSDKNITGNAPRDNKTRHEFYFGLDLHY